MVRSKVNSPGVDLHLSLSPEGSRRAALGEALRDSVRSGRLEPGTKLPSYRALAEDLNIARNTVAEIYGELVSEGWLEARQGSGTRVTHRGAVESRASSSVVPAATRPQFDLRPGRPDPAAFPRAAWLSAARRAIYRSPTDAFGPGDPHGRIELRRALADYLARTRGVRTDARRIIICSGFAQAAQILTDSGRAAPFALESYGLPFHRMIFDKAGPSVAIAMDERGCLTDTLGSTEARTVVLTPSHQFPTGASLHPQRRTAAIEWARQHDGLIVEDDYDGEFRYDRTPVGAMQSLDPDRVLYVGSVSKSLSPGIRVGWMAVPEFLLDPILAAKGEREATVGVVDQLTLAELIVTGAYDRHVRAVRTKYRRRRDELVRAVNERAPHVAAMGISAGLQAVLTLPAGSAKTVLRASSEIGLALESLEMFRHPDSPDAPVDAVLVGFSAPSDNAYPQAIDALVSILTLTAPGRRTA
ncbi:PLP-dependent aminotransferase family protein [Rhodococcus sp. G-MC3]|uniref:MocR-like pyridoxine biosynthesis transcription factor PdxR n=1 Tax=Rhodococcus sp. G-MC3 TaxID=3046209 RepID=UPI0024B9F46F|nr:PLP-dependent aminotransferase family protein [Rhodococcus sp. G-MC3]MDJ0394797.1 PLP-dependent aminotransferase family protein [Rhodococcus sp. G-MC3]